MKISSQNTEGKFSTISEFSRVNRCSKLMLYKLILICSGIHQRHTFWYEKDFHDVGEFFINITTISG